MSKISLIQGPNLNLLGTRESHIYGRQTLADIHARLSQLATEGGASLACFQSNSEGALVDHLQQLPATDTRFIIINPAAYTHTSVALRDALLAIAIPFIEVHLSNIYAREAFRHISYLRDIAVGSVIGLGPLGYELALSAAINYLEKKINGYPQN